jgi:ribose/xylose/arabinose/galactoside ABC-type transport system permease subunit
MREMNEHERRARVFGWRLVGVIVAVFLLAGLLVALSGWMWTG